MDTIEINGNEYYKYCVLAIGNYYKDLLYRNNKEQYLKLRGEYYIIKVLNASITLMAVFGALLLLSLILFLVFDKRILFGLLMLVFFINFLANLVVFIIYLMRSLFFPNDVNSFDFGKKLLQKRPGLILNTSACEEELINYYANLRLHEYEQEEIKRQMDSEFIVSLENGASAMDTMSGLEFELFCSLLLKSLGFTRIYSTKATGDQGVDILAEKGIDVYAIQCKRYSGSVGNASIQEVYTGSRYYDAKKCMVITNSHFTKSALELAQVTNVELIDGNQIKKYVNSYKESFLEKCTESTQRNKLSMYSKYRDEYKSFCLLKPDGKEKLLRQFLDIEIKKSCFSYPDAQRYIFNGK